MCHTYICVYFKADCEKVWKIRFCLFVLGSERLLVQSKSHLYYVIFQENIEIGSYNTGAH